MASRFEARFHGIFKVVSIWPKISAYMGYLENNWIVKIWVWHWKAPRKMGPSQLQSKHSGSIQGSPLTHLCNRWIMFPTFYSFHLNIFLTWIWMELQLLWPTEDSRNNAMVSWYQITKGHADSLCSVDSPTQAPHFRDQTVQLWEARVKWKSHLEALWMENWLWYISDHAAFECSRLWSHKYYGEEQGQGISTLLAWIFTSESVSIIKWLFFVAVIVQLLSHIWPCNTNAARQAPLSSSKSQSLIKFMSIELVMISHHIILCCPLLLLSSIFPSIRVFSSESALCIRWLEDWSFSHNISISNEIQGWYPLRLSGLISLKSKGLSRIFSSTIWMRQFFGTEPSLWSNFHIHTWLLEKPQLWLYRPLLAKWCLCFLIHCLGLS